jgi:hypothetical protein
MPSPGQNPGALNHAIEGWGPGVGSRRDPSPATPKGSRTFIVAAGGCPASSRQGWREGLGAPAGPAFRQGAGLTADLSIWRGKRGFPSRQQVALRAAALRLHPRQGKFPPGGR